MTYKRYKSETSLLKAEKVSLMREYVDYYERQVEEAGLDVLNVKIPREVFSPVLDQIGTLLNEHAIACSKEGPVKDFLDENPLPPHMRELMPEDFRAFALMLNALKQWVVAESAATDRYLLGGTARKTCRAAVSHCIVTGGELGEDAELHHPLRDGRPPILLSKAGHQRVESNHQNGRSSNAATDDRWARITELKRARHMSWVQLREGCSSIIDGVRCTRPGAKSFANLVVRETGLTPPELLALLDDRGLGV